MAKKEKRPMDLNAAPVKDRLFEVECPSCKQDFRKLVENYTREYAGQRTKISHAFPIWHSCSGREYQNGAKTQPASFCVGESGY